MPKYKLKKGVVCHPFGTANKQVVNKLSENKSEAENQLLLTDQLAEFLIESERLKESDFEIVESKKDAESKKDEAPKA